MGLLKRLKLTPTQASFALKNGRVSICRCENLPVKQGKAVWGTNGSGVGEKGRFSDEKSESKENIISS
jgi:hypothetical protein